MQNQRCESGARCLARLVLALFAAQAAAAAHPKCKQVFFAGLQWDLKCAVRGPGKRFRLIAID